MGYRRDNQHHNYNKKDVRDYEYRAKKLPIKGNKPSNVTVEPKGNEPIEKTIKRFLRKVKKSSIADEYKKRRFYEKPSDIKRKQRKRREAVLRKLRQNEVK
jgi:small subunit ribosomal protein S21